MESVFNRLTVSVTFLLPALLVRSATAKVLSVAANAGMVAKTTNAHAISLLIILFDVYFYIIHKVYARNKIDSLAFSSLHLQRFNQSA